MRKLAINEVAYAHIVMTLQENIDALKTKINQELEYFYDSNDYSKVKKQIIDCLDEIADLKGDLGALYNAKHIDNEDE